MPRVLFGMIENISRPAGGVKVIFQAVGALRRAGIDAFVASPGAVPGWLDGSRAVRDVAIADVTRPIRLMPEDLYVATDVIGPHRLPMLLGRPERRVIFFQGHQALTRNTSVDWTRLRHIRGLTVSDYSRRHLREVGGFADVSVVSPPIDPETFRPAVKRHQIAYMPAKRPGLAERLRETTGSTLDWVAISGRTERETAAILAESSVFVNFGRDEGFGLPPLEAMASGCVVCGFAGGGTSDYATAENGFWVPDGDVDGCRRALAAAIEAAANPERAGRMMSAGRETVRRYSVPAFEAAMTSYIRSLL